MERETGGQPLLDTALLVVDHHRIVREGVRAMLQERVAAVHTAASASEALETAREHEPDVALVALYLPGGSALPLIRQLRDQQPRPQAVVLSPVVDDRAFFQAVVAGAVGYLVEDIDTDELVEALTVVAAGGSLISPQVIDELRERRAALPVDNELVSSLTGQERRILSMVAEGTTNREIARRLDLAEKTVRNYVSNILAKMGARNRTELAALVIRAAMVEAPVDGARRGVPDVAREAARRCDPPARRLGGPDRVIRLSDVTADAQRRTV